MIAIGIAVLCVTHLMVLALGFLMGISAAWAVKSHTEDEK